ncbi:MAG: hypothetical protein A3J74_08645 [Elusimicrobia bacterium RIFCSPHIGHO2_02_FULL_57_9]|nr:MAG: hypothetical protein A3J74_08645 [Elusimicrobia bacterium RIFCSPHIGHO2_02_FULL_57_9]
MRRAAALALLLLPTALQAAKLRLKPKPVPLRSGLKIDLIKIETYNIFETRVYPESKLLYRIVNAAHWTTREEVIRRELLFSQGDGYNPALLVETERNLRRLPFLRKADVAAKVNKRGRIDVTVRTYDAWTLELIANFKRAGGSNNWKAGLADHNLTGQGKNISAVYNNNGASVSRNLSWKDPQFLGRSHLENTLEATTGPDSKTFSFGLKRPFYASISPSALGFKASYASNNVATYSGQTLTGTVQKRAIEAGLNYGIALGISTQRNRRLTAGLLHQDTSYSPFRNFSPDRMPQKEHLNFLQLGGEWEQQDFIKLKRIQKFTRIEDFNLGFGIFPNVSWSPYIKALSGTESQALPKVSVRKGLSWANNLLLLRGDYTSTYSNGGNGNRVASVKTFYYNLRFPRQTLAFQTAYDHGWRLDPSISFPLGEMNGLRGYGLEQFHGDRRLLFNAEDRIFIMDELWRLFDIGGAAFYDMGYAFPAGTPARIFHLKHSVGLGLRLAPSRWSGNNPVRIDLARALNDNGSRSRWSLSILAGHAFGPDSE